MVHAAPSPVEAAMRRARPPLEAALRALVEARARGAQPVGERQRLAEVLAAIHVYGGLFGRFRTLKESDAVSQRLGLSLAREGVYPLIEVPFQEAIRDLVTREPRLERDYQALAALYSSERVFGLSQSADLVVTQRVLEILESSMERAGPGRDAVEAAIAGTQDFTRAYAENVMRTNFATMYEAGRLEKAKDPAVRAVTPALRFTAVSDSRTRPNHAAADGIVAAADDPIWRIVRPPLGYLCRCHLDLMSLDECRRMGIVGRDGTIRRATLPPGAGPDPGFRP